MPLSSVPSLFPVSVGRVCALSRDVAVHVCTHVERESVCVKKEESGLCIMVRGEGRFEDVIGRGKVRSRCIPQALQRVLRQKTDSRGVNCRAVFFCLSRPKA